MKDETIDSSTDDAKLIPDKDKDKHLLKHWFMGIASQLIDDDDHPGYVSAKPGTSNTIPSCRECGAALQPGFNGSTVQLKRVTRPPRKRQPSRRKILHMNTSDKVCRNKLVVCCGTCERTTSYPGLPRRSKNNIDSTAKNMERKQSWINTVKNNKTKEKLMRNELKSSNGSKDSAAAAAAAAASWNKIWTLCHWGHLSIRHGKFHLTRILDRLCRILNHYHHHHHHHQQLQQSDLRTLELFTTLPRKIK